MRDAPLRLFERSCLREEMKWEMGRRVADQLIFLTVSG